MTAYILRRLAGMVPLLIGITFVSFLVIRLAPGSPVDLVAEMNPKTSAHAREKLVRMYHLDEPVPVQYWLWLKRIALLDFGDSMATDGRPVIEKIGERLPVTIGINVASMVLILAIAIPLGVLSAVRSHSAIDRVTTVLVFIGFSMPGFWLSLLLMKWFGVDLGWLPVSGIRSLDWQSLSPWGRIVDVARHLVLPLFVSAFGGLAGLSRFMRSSLLEVIRQDYVTTARAKGLPERLVIYRHALRNGLLPVVTILGLSLPGLIGGSVIFESIFAIPGLGQLYYLAVVTRDYTLIMGGLVIVSFLTLLGNLIADISYALVDPRISFRGGDAR